MNKIIATLALTTCICLAAGFARADCLDSTYPPLGAQGEYLGLSGIDPFEIGDIKADVVILVVSSYFCGPCHTEAEKLREVHDLIDAKGLSEKIKIFSVAAGDKTPATWKFAGMHSLRYPIIPDPNLSLTKACGSTKVPMMFIYKLDPDPKEIYAHLGVFRESPAQFLTKVEKMAGLK